MSTGKVPTGTKISGYFEWRINKEIVHTNEVYINNDATGIHIAGYVDFAGPNQKIIAVQIDPKTPSGLQTFEPGKWLKDVAYLSNWGEARAFEGEYEANLNYSPKQHKLNFNLRFVFDGGSWIKGELDVREPDS